MEQGDIYLHYKGKEYMFEGIAHPLLEKDIKDLEFVGVVLDANSPEDGEVLKLDLYMKDNKFFIVGEETRVIYYSDLEYETGNLWGRIYGDFYSDVVLDNGDIVPRFDRK